MNESWEAYLPAWLARAARTLSDIAGVILVGMMLLTVFDILGRSAGFGSIGSVIELSGLSVLVIVCFGLAGCTAAGSHNVIDLFTRGNAERTNRIIDAFWLLVMAAIVGLIAWFSMREAIMAHNVGERSEVLHWSPLVSATPAVAGLTLAVIVALTIGITAFRRIFLPADHETPDRE
jgi:TRAP-type C4-dicarboxylate transport system permease small subunit